MKTIISSYTFNPATRQVTFTGITSLALEQLLLITNATRNTIIYNFADSTLGGTLSGNVLTLTLDTTSMSAGDRLQIFIDDLTVPSLEATQQELVGSIETLRMVVDSLSRSIGQAMPDTAGRLRVLVDAITGSLTLATITTVSTVTTVSTLSNQTQVGGYSATEQIPALTRISAESIRRNITVG